MSYFDNSSKIDEWLVRRREKMTSSENHKLLKKSTQKENELWSGTALTYIEGKVIEIMTVYYERPELDEVEALLHGKENEYPAVDRYIQETKNYSMTYLGDETPLFIPDKNMPNESGGTPDVANILPDGSIDAGAEVKAPKNPSYHFKRLSWRTQWDVKEGYLSAYTQIQDLMRVTGATQWDFISFDKRQRAKKDQIVIIPVKRDEKFIDNLDMRIRLAVKEKYKILSKKCGQEMKCKEDYLKYINQ